MGPEGFSKSRFAASVAAKAAIHNRWGWLGGSRWRAERRGLRYPEALALSRFGLEGVSGKRFSNRANEI